MVHKKKREAYIFKLCNHDSKCEHRTECVITIYMNEQQLCFSEILNKMSQKKMAFPIHVYSNTIVEFLKCISYFLRARVHCIFSFFIPQSLSWQSLTHFFRIIIATVSASDKQELLNVRFAKSDSTVASYDFSSARSLKLICVLTFPVISATTF